MFYVASVAAAILRFLVVAIVIVVAARMQFINNLVANALCLSPN